LQEFRSCRIGGQIPPSSARPSPYASYLIQAPPSSRSSARMWLALVIPPDGPAPKGQESLAQGLPWVRRNKRFALKGLEMCTQSGSKARSQFSPYLPAPSGLIPLRELTQGKPWAMLFWPLRATDWKPPNCRVLRRMTDAKHMQDRSSGVQESQNKSADLRPHFLRFLFDSRFRFFFCAMPPLLLQLLNSCNS
jgi:hypothetical protein